MGLFSEFFDRRKHKNLRATKTQATTFPPVTSRPAGTRIAPAALLAPEAPAGGSWPVAANWTDMPTNLLCEPGATVDFDFGVSTPLESLASGTGIISPSIEATGALAIDSDLYINGGCLSFLLQTARELDYIMGMNDSNPSIERTCP